MATAAATDGASTVVDPNTNTKGVVVNPNGWEPRYTMKRPTRVVIGREYYNATVRMHVANCARCKTDLETQFPHRAEDQAYLCEGRMAAAFTSWHYRNASDGPVLCYYDNMTDLIESLARADIGKESIDASFVTLNITMTEYIIGVGSEGVKAEFRQAAAEIDDVLRAEKEGVEGPVELHEVRYDEACHNYVKTIRELFFCVCEAEKLSDLEPADF